MRLKIIRKAIHIIMVTTWLFLLFFSWNLPVVKGAEEDSVKEEAQRLARELTAIQLLKSTIEGLGQKEIDKEILEDQILKNPKDHKNKGQSEVLLKSWTENQLRISLKAEMANILKEVNKGREWVSQEWLEKQFKRSEQEVESTIQTVIREKFPSAFESARSSAVEKQWKKIETGFYPEPTEVEAIDKIGKEERAKIEAKLKGKMAGQIILFEESESSIEKTINSVIDDGLRQLREQRNLIRSSNTAGITEIAIFNNLQRELKEYIKRNESESGKIHVYDVFPSVREYLPKRARELMEGRFREYISSDQISQFVDQKRIEDLIKESPQKHYKPEESLTALRKKLIPEIKNKVIAAYSEKAEEDDEKFQGKLQNLLKEQRINSALEENASRLLEKETQETRNKISEEQLKKHFPKIISKEWDEVSEEYIKEYKLHNKTIGINDFVKQHTKDRPILLQETEEKLNQVIIEMLDEGIRALNGQLDIVDRYRDDILSKIKEDQGGHNQDYWKQLYINKVGSEWKKERISKIWGNKPFQPYMKKRYSELFSEAEKKINEVITEHFERLLVAAVEPKKTPILSGLWDKLSGFLDKLKGGLKPKEPEPQQPPKEVEIKREPQGKMEIGRGFWDGLKEIWSGLSGLLGGLKGLWDRLGGLLDGLKGGLMGLGRGTENLLPGTEFGVSIVADKAIYSMGEPISLEIRVFNHTEEEVIFRFNSNQRFDFLIEDDRGSKIWRWSDGMKFEAISGKETIGPGNEEIIYKAKFEGKLNPGSYKITGILVDKDRLVSGSVTIGAKSSDLFGSNRPH